MKCTECGFTSRESAEETKCFFCKRGNSKELSILGHSILHALGKKAPTASKAETEERKKERAAKNYIAKIEDTGFTSTKDAYMAIVGNKFDGEMNAETFNRLLISLVIIRGDAFKHAKPYVFQASDAVLLRELLKAFTPARIAKAIIAASQDEFWKNKSFTFQVMPKHINALLVKKQNQSKAGDATKERRAQVMNEITMCIEKMKETAPFDAVEFEQVDRSMMDIGTLEILLKQLKSKL
jgi:hypothetical protein